MPAEPNSFRIICGRFVAIFISFMQARAKHAVAMFRYTLRARSAQVHCVFLTVILLQLLVCANDIETNPGPPMINGEGGSMSTSPSDDNDRITSSYNDISAQQQLDRVFTAINQLARNVSELSDRLSISEKGHKQTASRIDKRLGEMECTINKKLAEVEGEHNVLRLDIDVLEDRCEDTRSLTQKLEKTVENLEAKVETMDNESRRKNLLFFGIPRVFGETGDDCESKVRDVIYHDMRIHETVLICHVQRIGSAILVQFQSSKQREAILRGVKELRAIRSPVYVREDFTKKVRRRREGLGPLLKQLREDGKRARLRQDKLITEDGTYTYDLEEQEYQRLEPNYRPDGRQEAAEIQQPREDRHQSRSTDNEGWNSHTSWERNNYRPTNRQDRPAENRHQWPKERQHTNSNSNNDRHRARWERQDHSADDSKEGRTTRQYTHQYTQNVNKPPGATSADYDLPLHINTHSTSPEGSRLRGCGRGRGRGSPFSHCPRHASPGFDDGSPTEEGATLPRTSQASTGTTTRPSEAFDDAEPRTQSNDSDRADSSRTHPHQHLQAVHTHATRNPKNGL
ncbi:hypothetical protein V1264_011234 [Littorina saxatilis]|uniref:Uncharacterized protein n=1 Tax=Littorina saxatilis TaxID=31220 RepID=A0AAN9GK07_9CAEN